MEEKKKSSLQIGERETSQSEASNLESLMVSLVQSVKNEIGKLSDTANEIKKSVEYLVKKTNFNSPYNSSQKQDVTSKEPEKITEEKNNQTIKKKPEKGVTFICSGGEKKEDLSAKIEKNKNVTIISPSPTKPSEIPTKVAENNLKQESSIMNSLLRLDKTENKEKTTELSSFMTGKNKKVNMNSSLLKKVSNMFGDIENSESAKPQPPKTTAPTEVSSFMTGKNKNVNVNSSLLKKVSKMFEDSTDNSKPQSSSENSIKERKSIHGSSQAPTTQAGKSSTIAMRQANLKKASKMFNEADRSAVLRKIPSLSEDTSLEPAKKEVMRDEDTYEEPLSEKMQIEPSKPVMFNMEAFVPQPSKTATKHKKGFRPPKTVLKPGMNPDGTAKLTDSQEEILLSVIDSGASDPTEPHQSDPAETLPTPQKEIEVLNEKHLSSGPESESKRIQTTKVASEKSEILDQSALCKAQEIFQDCYNIQPISLTLDVKVETIRNSPPFYDSTISFPCYCRPLPNAICTLCKNTRVLKPDQISMVVCSASRFVPHWVAHHLKVVHWKLASLQQYTPKKLLTLPNIFYQLQKRNKKEYQEKKTSSISLMINRKLPASVHCVFLVVQIKENEINKAIAAELSDGYYSIHTKEYTAENEGGDALIYKLLKSGRIRVGQKLHCVNSEILVQASGKVGRNRLGLNYNGISLARFNEKLGLHRKSYLYKSVRSLRPHGGRVQLIDLWVLSIENKVVSGRDWYGESEPSFKLRLPSAKLEVNYRYKMFNLNALEEDGKLCLEETEDTHYSIIS